MCILFVIFNTKIIFLIKKEICWGYISILNTLPTCSFLMWKCLWQMSLKFLLHWIIYGNIVIHCKFSCSVPSHDQSNICHISVNDTLKSPLDRFMTSGLHGQLSASVCFMSVKLHSIFTVIMPVICIQFYVLLQAHVNQPM